MADNFTLEAVTTPGQIAAGDEVAGVIHQRVLVEFGPDGAPVQVNTGASALPIQDGGNSITVDGSVTATLGGSLPAGTNNIGDVDVLSLPSIPAGANNIGDVDVLTVPAPLSTAGNGTAAAAHRVTIASDSTGQVAIAGSLPAGANNIGDVDIATVPAPLNVTGNGAAATALRVTMANDSTGIVAATVSQATASSLNAEVQGDQARDAGITANPVLVGGRSGLTAPTAVTADNELVEPWLDRVGRTTVKQSSDTATTTQVADNAASTQLLASSTSRLGATIWNDSTAILFVKLGTTASTTDYTVQIVQGAYYEVPYGYRGRIDGIWASDPNTGSARITELT